MKSQWMAMGTPVSSNTNGKLKFIVFAPHNCGLSAAVWDNEMGRERR